MAMEYTTCSSLSFAALPDEILHHILSLLAIPDLLQCSRTCHHFRILANDPVLHHERLQWASRNLERELRRRKTRATISPPNAYIFLNKTNLLSRAISRSLIRIRLTHSLEQRPSTHDLVTRAILPQCITVLSPALIQSQQAMVKHRLKDDLNKKLERRPSITSLASMNILPEEYAKKIVCPALLETRRSVIKESLKDGLRAWVASCGLRAQHQRALELDEHEKVTVKALVRRITARRLAMELEEQADAGSMNKKKIQARWGRALEVQKLKEESRSEELRGCKHPPRARVLNLKKFWEGVMHSTTT